MFSSISTKYQLYFAYPQSIECNYKINIHGTRLTIWTHHKELSHSCFVMGNINENIEYMFPEIEKTLNVVIAEYEKVFTHWTHVGLSQEIVPDFREYLGNLQCVSLIDKEYVMRSSKCTIVRKETIIECDDIKYRLATTGTIRFTLNAELEPETHCLTLIGLVSDFLQKPVEETKKRKFNVDIYFADDK